MKTAPLRATLSLALIALATSVYAQLSIPSDGSDGALNITTNTVIDLSQAVTGTWSGSDSGNAGKGIYDPVQWAVVFKFSSVNIASNAVVTFLNHPKSAPVVWLVSGDVTINGEVNLDGQGNSADPLNLPKPGPGGFRGGALAQPALPNGDGFGPGEYNGVGFGVYGPYPGQMAYSYGNIQIVPLIGGSGGVGTQQGNGGAGGGAMLIAASGNITINGNLHANGGAGTGCCGGQSYPGSGGAIRLVANQILGSGQVIADYDYPGRIRLEANNTSSSLIVNPPTVGVSPSPLVIWPAPTAPTATIVSIAGQTVPSDPAAAMPVSNNGDDLTISTNGVINIVVQTANFPTNGTVNVYIEPRNGSKSISQATLVSGTMASATWQLQKAPPDGHFVVQVRAVSP